MNAGMSSVATRRPLLEQPVPHGVNEGRTLTEILSFPDAAPGWVAWALRQAPGYWGERFEEALAEACRELDRRSRWCR